MNVRYIVHKGDGFSIPITTTAAFIFTHLKKGKKIADIAEILTEDYTVTQKKAVHDASRFINLLNTNGIDPKQWRLLKNIGVFHPLSAFLQVTWKCNLRCIHCYAYTSDAPPRHRELTTQEWYSIIRGLKYHLDVPSITFIGGEPLMRKDLSNMISYCNDLRFERIVLSTNGSFQLIKHNREAITALKKTTSFVGVAISLEGGSAKVHDEIRGKGSFDDTIKGIRELINEGILIELSAVVTARNIHDMENLIKLANSMGIEVLELNMLIPCGRSIYNTELHLSAIDYIKFFRRVTKLSSMYTQTHVSVSQLPPARFLVNKNRTLKNSNLCGCPAGVREIYISPEGYVIPCPVLLPYKNFRSRSKATENSIKRIWFQDKWLRYFRDLYVNPCKKMRSKCKLCRWIFICRGGCHAAAFFTKGNFAMPDPRCAIKPYVANHRKKRYKY